MTNQVEQALIEDVAQYADDPVGFAQYAYDWGYGELAGSTGQRTWQKEIGEIIREHLRNPETRFKPLKIRVASGHGIGKSAGIGQIIHWGMSTCPNTKVVVTANTATQISTKTWPEVSKWFRLAVNKHWFQVNATSIHIKNGDPKAWRADAIPWSENNTEAFAGLHNQGKRIIIVYDESSAISDKVWEVTEGALTDENTEIIWIAYGNPTRNNGRFFQETFGAMKHRCVSRSIDSRLVEGTNKEQIKQWEQDYGEDSDFFRVRCRGIPPRASSLQFIGSDLVAEARKRDARCNITDPLIMALDIARGGDDSCVFAFRRGLDAQTFKSIVIPGALAKDSMALVAKAVDLLDQHKPDAFFFDGTGVGGPVGDRIRQLGYQVHEVQFGSESPDPKQANLRAYMYQKLKDWLRSGGAIEDSNDLEIELTNIEFGHNKRDQLLLESKEKMKERGLASPDRADALAMTFAFPVSQKAHPTDPRGNGPTKKEWDPYSA